MGDLLLPSKGSFSDIVAGGDEASLRRVNGRELTRERDGEVGRLGASMGSFGKLRIDSSSILSAGTTTCGLLGMVVALERDGLWMEWWRSLLMKKHAAAVSREIMISCLCQRVWHALVLSWSPAQGINDVFSSFSTLHCRQ